MAGNVAACMNERGQPRGAIARKAAVEANSSSRGMAATRLPAISRSSKIPWLSQQQAAEEAAQQQAEEEAAQQEAAEEASAEAAEQASLDDSGGTTGLGTTLGGFDDFGGGVSAGGGS
jgi:non-ribosomal peptide synthetase component E (peptide arylation enzyme)